MHQKTSKRGEYVGLKFDKTIYYDSLKGMFKVEDSRCYCSDQTIALTVFSRPGDHGIGPTVVLGLMPASTNAMTQQVVFDFNMTNK